MKLCQLISLQLITSGAGRSTFIIPEGVLTLLEENRAVIGAMMPNCSVWADARGDDVIIYLEIFSWKNSVASCVFSFLVFVPSRGWTARKTGVTAHYKTRSEPPIFCCASSFVAACPPTLHQAWRGVPDYSLTCPCQAVNTSRSSGGRG